MLNLRRRHLRECPHRDTRYLKCRCPLWAIGSFNGKFVRKSLDTRSVERGHVLIRDMELGKTFGVSLKDAWGRFLTSRETKGSSEETLAKLRRLREGMEAYFGEVGLRSISVDELARFQEGWNVSPITARKQVERLRSFFKFCMSRKWVDDNPAAGLEMPKVASVAVKPFTPDEMERILWAVPLFPTKGVGDRNRDRVRAFVLTLRWTGLRVRDVVQLKRSEVRDGFIVLRTHKNKKPVKLPLHPDLGGALEKMTGDEYFFWSGIGNARSCVGDFQRTLRRLSTLAGVHIHAHRFRHTFATDLLSKGVPVSEVAAILGNSPRIVEQHYSQWIEARQTAINEAVMKTW